MGPPQSPRADGLMFGGGGAAGGGARVSGPGSASMSEVWGVGHQLVKYPRLKGSPTGLNYSMNTTFTPYGGGGGHGAYVRPPGRRANRLFCVATGGCGLYRHAAFSFAPASPAPPRCPPRRNPALS